MTSYGFTYNGIHSDTMGITLNKTIHGVLPPLAASKQKVPKRAGSWYTRTDKGDRWIQCQITVTGTSHTDLRSKIRQIAGWLNPTDTPQPLVFDNEPNITYYAVVDEGGMGGNGSQGTDISQIVTLGQGTIIFMCPVPFAYGAAHSQGIDAPTGTFSRNSVANDPNTLASIALGVPRFVPGKFGNGVFIEEGTTNIVYNSDFETTTATATVFADALTSYTGSAVPAPWTLQSGSFTFSASGATSGTNGSLITAGNASWKPLLGSDGTTKLVLKAEATFKTTSTPSTSEFGVYLYVDANNQYLVNINGTGSDVFPILKKVAGTYTTLNSVAFTPTPSTSYTVTLQLDNTGNLTATITPSGGSTTTITVSDTSLSGGFQIGVGGDAGTVISNASVIAPWADHWTLGGDSRVAWALDSTNPINGKYSVSVVGLSGVSGYATQQPTGIVTSVSYTISGFINSSNVGSSAAQIYGYVEATYLGVHVTGTTSTTRRSSTVTSASTAGNSTVGIEISDSGTAVFDSIQLEQKPYATSYMRNDSISATATRDAEILTFPANTVDLNSGSVSFWVTPSLSVAANEYQVAFSAFQVPNANGMYWLGWTGTGWGCPDLNLEASTASAPYTKGTPVHICATWSGTSMTVYVNGVSIGTGQLGAGFTLSDAVRIGHFVGNGFQIDASIDELLIFNRTLTAAEVTSLYQATSATPPVTDGLTGLYPFDSDVANSPQPVDVQGTAETLPVITANFTSASTNYKATHVETGNLVNILHNFVAGDELVIDCTKNSVTINGANALTDLDIASDFFQLASGSNTFTVQSPGDAITELAYTERWL